MNFTIKETYTIDDLRHIMEVLRSDEGCPWDKLQDHRSIRKNMIEEAYEVCEAIDLADPALLQEELGDVLMQVVFHSQMETELGSFNFDNVCDGVCKKLIARHPHVFSNWKAEDADQVLENWELIKRKTKGQDTFTASLQSVPKVLPALMRSQKVQSRAAKSGFDYADISDALEDLKREVGELEAALQMMDWENTQEELGDLLFSCVNVARLCKLESEELLLKSCDKFVARFSIVEKLAMERSLALQEQTPEELLQLWKKAKVIHRETY